MAEAKSEERIRIETDVLEGILKTLLWLWNEEKL